MWLTAHYAGHRSISFCASISILYIIGIRTVRSFSNLTNFSNICPSTICCVIRWIATPSSNILQNRFTEMIQTQLLCISADRNQNTALYSLTEDFMTVQERKPSTTKLNAVSFTIRLFFILVNLSHFTAAHGCTILDHSQNSTQLTQEMCRIPQKAAETGRKCYKEVIGIIILSLNFTSSFFSTQTFLMKKLRIQK